MTSFLRQAPARGDATALIAPNGERISWADLASRVDEQTATIKKRKALVAIEARRTAETVVAYLAALEAGAAVAMLAPDDPDAWRRFQQAYRPQFGFRGDAPDGRFETYRDAPDAEIHPDLALLLSTSGSTGSGKFVRLSAANLHANAQAVADYLGLVPDDRAALLLPLNYCYGLSVLHAHLCAGASVSLAHGSAGHPDLSQDLRRHGCTNLSGVPHTYSLLEETGFRRNDPAPLRFMTVAGGRLEPALVARYRRHLERQGGCFFVMYGQTEATARMAYVPPERLAGNEDRIGVPIPGGELRLVAADGAEITAPDTPGELVYRGPNVMMGYAQGAPDLARGPETPELRTGDLGARDADGMFRVVGRLRRMSKISGLRISHDALEHALAREGIDAAVVGDDRRILALHASRRADAEICDRLAAVSGLPRLLIRAKRVATLPRMRSGKIDYEAAKAELAAASDEPPRGVRALYAETFAPNPVKGDDSFVDLGGDSLRFVQLSIALERRLGPLPEGWERRPIAEIERLQTAAEPKAAKAPPAISSDLAIRALAILLVVVHHATHWPIPGGAAAMLVLIGYSLWRLQGDALANGLVGRAFCALPLILAPYYLILAAYAVAWSQIPWASALLIGNFGFADPVRHDMLPYLYWFVEIYVQTLLIVAGLFLLPPVRAWARRNPFGLALAFLAVALALRFTLAEHWSFGGRQIFTIPWNLYLVAFGWAAAAAREIREKLLLLGLAAIVFPAAAYYGGDWTGSWVKYMIQLGVVAVLLFLPRIRLPRLAVAAILPVAAAGYHIYLFHRLLPEHAPELLGKSISHELFTTVSVLAGVASGFLAYEVQKAVLRALRSWRETVAKQGAPRAQEP